jgi:hypothetical protein
LNTKLPKEELEMISYALEHPYFIDVTKHRFKKRYFEIYQKYQKDLDEKFELIRDEGLEEWVHQNHKIFEPLYKLKSREPKIDQNFNLVDIEGFSQLSSLRINHSKDFLYWYRSRVKDSNFDKHWHYLNLLIDVNLDNYFDCQLSDDDLIF